jgi:hypothetical protein
VNSCRLNLLAANTVSLPRASLHTLCRTTGRSGCPVEYSIHNLLALLGTAIAQHCVGSHIHTYSHPSPLLLSLDGSIYGRTLLMNAQNTQHQVNIDKMCGGVKTCCNTNTIRGTKAYKFSITHCAQVGYIWLREKRHTVTEECRLLGCYGVSLL